ncbi:MAG: hypothetical protein FWD22_02300 [Treponema sp.]|nr:hypothetical protein [Treponema sp.]
MNKFAIKALTFFSDKAIFSLIGSYFRLSRDYFCRLFIRPHGLGVLFLSFAASKNAYRLFPLTNNESISLAGTGFLSGTCRE